MIVRVVLMIMIVMKKDWLLHVALENLLEESTKFRVLNSWLKSGHGQRNGDLP